MQATLSQQDCELLVRIVDIQLLALDDVYEEAIQDKSIEAVGELLEVTGSLNFERGNLKRLKGLFEKGLT